MKIFGQPESYSDILQRIFYTSVGSGIICTFILAKASPNVQAIIDSVSTQVDIGPIKGLKALYVVFPIGVSLISRMLRLHDKISDVLRIRLLFDTRYILFPLAELSGHDLTKELKEKIRSNRNAAMHVVFYPYAGFMDPAIDKQLVRSAADNWGWFWVLIESAFIFGLTAVTLWILQKNTYLQVCLWVLFLHMCLLLVEWVACRQAASRQVKAVLADSSRRSDVWAYFTAI